MKEKDLKNVLQKHNIWLESGRKKGERADLSGLGRGLSFVDLSGDNLTHAELKDAYLAHFKLRGVNLNGDNLTCAILDDTILDGADLSGSFLRANTGSGEHSELGGFSRHK